MRWRQSPNKKKSNVRPTLYGERSRERETDLACCLRCAPLRLAFGIGTLGVRAMVYGAAAATRLGAKVLTIME